MRGLLSTYTTGRDNNFNLIRFIAATLVLFSHSFAMAVGTGDAEPLRFTIGMTWGYMAVDVFFVTSGFLVTSSYFSRNNVWTFLWARILRIYPALIVAVIFCVFVVGAWFTTIPLREFFLDNQTQKYLVKNFLLFLGLEYELPGVFKENPYKNLVNGSLWTLPYEIFMYTSLAVILVLATFVNRRFKYLNVKNLILLISIISLGLHIFNHFHTILPDKFIRLFTLFFVGAACFVWRERICLSSKWFYLGLLILAVSTLNKNAYFLVYYLFLPYFILYVAYVQSGKIRNFNKIGDYSYGIYIYAFPVQQSIANIIPNVSVAVMIMLSFAVTLLLAISSWHLVEKKFLMMKASHGFRSAWNPDHDNRYESH